MITDSFNNPIDIGDKVIYTYSSSGTMYRGEVVRFSKSGLTVFIKYGNGRTIKRGVAFVTSIKHLL